MQDQGAGRTILVTGATDGIGRETALQLARMGMRVLLHGRNPQKGHDVLSEIHRETGNDHLELFLADLASQRQIRSMAAEIHERHDWLDVLINNAGVFMPDRRLTEDGIEVTFAVNHLAPFLLTHLLLDLLKSAAPSRVVTVSSGAHYGVDIDWDNLQGEKGYDGYEAYSLSKLCNVLFTFELAKRLKNADVTANCLEPGVIRTKLLREGWGGSSGQDPEKGAQRLVYLATSPEVEGVTGRYFRNNQPAEPNPLAQEPAVRKRLWDLSAKLTHFTPKASAYAPGSCKLQP